MTKHSLRIFKKEIVQYYQAAPYHEVILQHISQGIIFVNSKGIITTFNQSAADLLNVKTSEVLFKPYLFAFSNDFFGFSLKTVMESKESPKINTITWHSPESLNLEIEVESVYVKNDMKSHSYLLLDLDCHEGILILLRNVTELNRLQKIASQHNRLQDLGEMAARVAHEIRNPLGSIIGFVSLLQQDLKDQPELQKMAKYILEGTEELNQTVSNILTYSRSIEPHIVQSDIILLIRELMEQIQTDPLFTPYIQYVFHSNVEILPIFMDISLMKSALFNLIINALEAMPEGGVLTLECEKKAHEMHLKVSDTGLGIPEENIDKIFLPFFTTKITGNGLGLSEVQKVIQAQHGSIEVQSKLQKGTCFTIKMPLL